MDASDLSGAASAAQAATQSAAAMPGYSPAAGLAGVVIGLGIAKGMANSSLRKKANEPFEPLRGQYIAHWNELKFQDALLHEWDAHGSPELQRCDPEVTRKCPTRLTLKPELLLLSGGRVLCVTIEATLQDRKARSAYVSKVHFNSQPVAVSETGEINEYWSRENLGPIAEQWSLALSNMLPLLQVELERHGKPDPAPPQAIRFENAAGVFYDRGVILSQDEHRLVYRSLDNSITSAYMDRLLTTAEYYDWLAKQAPPPAGQ